MKNQPLTLLEDESALETRQQRYLQELGRIPSTYEEWMNSLSPQKRDRVRRHVNRRKHGLHVAAPLTCAGLSKCPFPQACPIPEKQGAELIPGPESDYPLGQECVLEHEYMIQRIGEYFVYLDVDPSNPIEMSMVQELALMDLQKNRALTIMSAGDKEGQGRDFLHVDESITGFSQGGRDQEAEPLVSRTTKIHPVYEFIHTLERRREKLWNSLMETRKAKADWAAKMGGVQQESKVLQELVQLKGFLAEFQQQPEVPLLTEEDGIGLDEEI